MSTDKKMMKWNPLEVITDVSITAHLGGFLFGVFEGKRRVKSEAEGSDREQGGLTAGMGLSTTASLLTRGPIHVPDLGNGTYKTEIVLYDGPGVDVLALYYLEGAGGRPPAPEIKVGTLKLTWWHAGDPRPLPHNHPWRDKDGISFRSSILSGGYTETVYRLDGSTEQRVYRAGDVNVARHDEYHVVSDVLPQTVTLMACGPRVKPEEGQSPWGYLLTGDDGRMVPVGPTHPSVMDPGAGDRFKALNPHLRR